MSQSNPKVTIIGAGLAGCEAAWQLANRQVDVSLVEMRPHQMTSAHHTAEFAELVCSNSLRSNQLTNGVGLLKEEMRRLNSLIIKCADENQIPAGSALAVDREQFSKSITQAIMNHPRIQVIHQEIKQIPSGPTIIATGPLTSDALAEDIARFTHSDSLYFYDAAAPIIEKDSIDFSIAYYKSRYDVGQDDYINCPMSKTEFNRFYEALIDAQVVPLRDFEKEVFFEGCMPIEEMARRGPKTMLFGPLKPVGLGQNDDKPYAVVQLRQDNAAATLYNIVGFQTHLTFGEQQRIIRLIPGLENASIVRYGVMHRNTYVNAPLVLEATYQTKYRPDIFLAGQITGVEGYVESAASGLLAGINMACCIKQRSPHVFSNRTMIGAMAHYITATSPKNFQPMNANFGIIKHNFTEKKEEKKQKIAQYALTLVDEWVNKHGNFD